MPLPSIILVDDHLIFRTSLKLLINNEKLGNVIGEASNGKEFLDILNLKVPDLVLMDIDMPVMDGYEASLKAIENHPGLKILVLTMFGDENYYYKMIQAKVKGFLLKTCQIKELENAINEVISGSSYFSNELLQKIILSFEKKNISKENTNSQLTGREVEILKYICKGYTNEEIADTLHISSKTVKGHRASLLTKTNSKNTASLVIYVIKNKIIEI